MAAIQQALVLAVIDGGLPLSMCEESWPYILMQAGSDIVKKLILDGQNGLIGTESKAAKELLRLLETSDPEKYKISRSTLTKAVDRECNNLISGYRQKILALARRYGATQVSDGRSNVLNDPLLVFAVSSGPGFFPIHAHNAGANKKNAEYLARISTECLKLDKDIAAETYASVSDGAPSCLSALQILAEREFLVPIRCQSHALSLLLKGIATGPFKEMIKKAGNLISWIRGRPRIHSFVKEASGDRAVFRFVEVRFATHVIACNRLLVLKSSIQGLVNNDDYVTYRQSLSVSDQATCKAHEEIVADNGFWSSIKAFTKVCLPATVALRLMDRSVARAKDVNRVWDALGNRLGVVLSDQTEALPLEKKKEVYSVFEALRIKSHRSVFDAAWALDPANLITIRKWSMECPTEEEQREWQRIKTNTHTILDLMIKRTVRMKLSTGEQQASKVPRQSSDMDIADAGMRDVDLDEFNKLVSDTSSKVRQEFVLYYAGFDQYEKLEMSTEQDWAKSDGLLKLYAVRVVNMACTISNVERLHKCYAGIHTASRNRLKLDRVDRITIARLIRRFQKVEEQDSKKIQPWFDATALEKFETLTPAEERAFVEWADVLKGALHVIQQTIEDPTGLEGLVDVDNENTSEGEEEILVEADEMIGVHNSALDSTSGTAPSLPSKLMETGKNLGLYGQYMQ